MADGLSFKMVTAPLDKALAEREIRMRRAAMWTVREGARVVTRAARAKAPVLGGGSGAAGYRAWRQSGASGTGPVPGLLKNSIRPARRLHQSGSSWSVRVGPRGTRAHLYAAKEELREGYMEAGFHAAEAMMAAVSASAYGKVWRGI
jgi:hypothetical protein